MKSLPNSGQSADTQWQDKTVSIEATTTGKTVNRMWLASRMGSKGKIKEQNKAIKNASKCYYAALAPAKKKK